ncbi:uncharacterized protein TRIADDRAFT_13664, partial [Trichoplax adhaerens]
FVIYLIYRFLIAPYLNIKKLGLPFPRPRPMVGNLFDFGPGNQHVAQMEWGKRYGRVYASLFFQIPTIWIGDPDMIKSVMVKEFSNFTNRFPVTKTLHPFDKSILELKDQDWKRMRNILIPTFTTSKLKLILPFISEASDILIDTLITADEEGKIIDLWQASGHYTMKVILATSFGIQIESEKQEEKLMNAAGALFRSDPGILQVLMIISPRVFSALEPKFGGPLVSSINYIIHLTKQVINERRRNIHAGVTCRRDLIQQMIEAGDNDKLNDDEIIAQAFIFLTAGYETTQNTLAFACYLLGTNPRVQQKLIDEIDSKCPDVNSVSYDIITNLPYLEMIVSETLRLYPPAHFINRDVKQDTTINGVHIPKGVMIGFPVYSIHHDPQFWSNPDDFIPERFMPEEKVKLVPYSYIPFGGGPRNCIGMRLALLEVKLALVKLMQKVKFTTVKETEIPLKLKGLSSLSPLNGIRLGIDRR